MPLLVERKKALNIKGGRLLLVIAISTGPNLIDGDHGGSGVMLERRMPLLESQIPH